jgi:hypothetical protein
MNRTSVFVCLWLSLGLSGLLCSAAPPGEEDLHRQWDDLLRRYVSAEGKVNYRGFVADREALKAYLRTLQEHPPESHWSRAQQMAYWINAYNAFTIDLIAEHYPIGSITLLDGGKTWDVKRISIGGVNYSLNDIENNLLRARFRDARIHFALNCAARSCPPLLARAYRPETLERTLEQRARAFIRDTRFNRIAHKRAEVSKIFEWYAADFRDLRAYLSRYSGIRIAPDAEIVFCEYDWGLNE